LTENASTIVHNLGAVEPAGSPSAVSEFVHPGLSLKGAGGCGQLRWAQNSGLGAADGAADGVADAEAKRRLANTASIVELCGFRADYLLFI
jgi:hypothetical protein